MFEGLEKRINKAGTISYWNGEEIVYNQCTKCKEIKNINSFYKHSKNKTDGHTNDCKECQSKRGKSYREANKEKVAEYHKRYGQANKEKIAQYKREWQLKNKERLNIKYKEWKEANKERVRYYKNEWTKKYYWENREEIRNVRKKYTKKTYDNLKKRNIENINSIINQIKPIFVELKLPIYGYIYKFKNIKNDKVYIGQTIQPLKVRYKVNIIKGWINDRVEKKKQKFIEELIEEDFEVTEVLDVGCCQYHLDKLEAYYINKYNSCENGYNNNIGYHRSNDGIEEFNQILKENNLEFVDGELRRICDER